VKLVDSESFQARARILGDSEILPGYFEVLFRHPIVICHAFFVETR